MGSGEKKFKPCFWWKKIDAYWPMFYSDVVWPEKGVGSLVLPLKPNRPTNSRFTYDPYNFDLKDSKLIFARNVLDQGLKIRKDYNNVRHITVMGNDPLHNKSLFFFRTWFEYLKKWEYHWDFCLYTTYRRDEIPEDIWKYVKYVVWVAPDRAVVRDLDYRKEVQDVRKNDYYIQLPNRMSRIYDSNKNLISIGRYYFDGEPKMEGI